MVVKNFLQKHTMFFSFILTILIAFVVDFFKVPNPNVILLTVIVYLTFFGGFLSGILSGLIVIVYSIYFFSMESAIIFHLQLQIFISLIKINLCCIHHRK